MRVLHITISMHPKSGGVAQAIRNIIINSPTGLHEVVCLDELNVEYDMHDDFIIHKIGRGRTSFQYHPGLNSWLDRMLTGFTHAVVHGIWQYHNFATYRVNKKIPQHKRPVLAIMPHGMLDPYFQKASGRRLKALRNDIVWALTEKWAVNAADALLFTCEEEMLLARSTFSHYKPRKELNVGLGVMAPPIENENMHSAFFKESGISNNYWLFLGRLHPKKGIQILIESYKKLCHEMQDIPYLVVAGPLDDAFSLQMKELAAGHSQIIFTGMLSGDAKWGAFYGCDAFILPSFQENFGIAIVEAMACQKAVVITRNINIWREIITGGGGFLIDEQTVYSVCNLLKKIQLFSKLKLREVGSKASATYLMNFNLEDCSKRFISMLRSV